MLCATAQGMQFNTRAAAIAQVNGTQVTADTSIALASGKGALIPATPCFCYYYNGTDYAFPMDDPLGEVVLVTAMATDTATVTRGQLNTVATNKNIGGKTYYFAPATNGQLHTALGAAALAPQVHTTIGDSGQQSNDFKSAGVLADTVTASTAATNLKLAPSAAAQSVQFPVGGSTSFAGGETIASIQVSAAGVACTAGSTDDTLFTYSLPANALKNVGDYVKVYAWGTGVATASTNKLWFGGTAFVSDGGVTSATPIIQKMTIIKTAASTQIVMTDDNYHGTTANIARVIPTTAAITDTSAIVIKSTANSAAATTLGNGLLVVVGHQ